MPKTKRARATKSARAKSPKRSKSVVEITADEVASLELQAASHKRSEDAWSNMTSAAHGGEEEHWTGIEEHLLAKGRQDQASERRWKYFAK